MVPGISVPEAAHHGVSFEVIVSTIPSRRVTVTDGISVASGVAGLDGLAVVQFVSTTLGTLTLKAESEGETNTVILQVMP